MRHSRQVERHSEEVVYVLIADDDKEIRSALRLALLEVTGQSRYDEGPREGSASVRCAVAEASDTAEMRAHLRGADVDVVLLDWELPGLDATTMPAEIRTHAPSCAVIAMSGRPEAREQSLASGADHFVSKNDPPLRLLELLRGLWVEQDPRAR